MTQTLTPIRQQTDVTLRVTLTDNGTRVSWLDASDIKAFLYSDRQRIIEGPCTWEVDTEDDTVLVCHYGAHQPQHLGKTKLIVEVTIQGHTSTYDKYAFEFVATTDETEDDGSTVEDEVAEVDIEVTDVDTSILTGAIAAALAAAEAANAAAGHAPYIGQNGNWWIWDAAAGEYTDSETSATGPQGPAGQDGADGQDGTDGRDGADGQNGADGRDGVDGGILYPSFHIDAAMHLQMSDAGTDANRRFAVNDAGHFIMTI